MWSLPSGCPPRFGLLFNHPSQRACQRSRAAEHVEVVAVVEEVRAKRQGIPGRRGVGGSLVSIGTSLLGGFYPSSPGDLALDVIQKGKSMFASSLAVVFALVPSLD